MSKNLGAVLYKTRDFRLEERPIRKPEQNEVLLAIQCVGICGTDVHFWEEGRVGYFYVNEPFVPGHEASAKVVEVGPGVTHLKAGDRVVIEPNVPCLRCELCKEGSYHHCPNVKAYSNVGRDGFFIQYQTIDAAFCFKIPDSISDEEGAVVEPLAVAVYAVRRANLKFGQSVLVLGAGPIGLLCMMTAKAMGASKVCITDLKEDRLEAAKKLGADHVFKVDSSDPREQATKIAQLMGGAPEVSFECSGAESSIRLSLLSTKSQGVVTLVGLGKLDINIPITDVALREVDLRGVFRYVNCFPAAIDLLARKLVNVNGIITRPLYKLEDIDVAFKRSHSGANGALKVMFDLRK